MRNYGDTIPSTIPGLRNVTIKQPVGVVGVITPWNVSLSSRIEEKGSSRRGMLWLIECFLGWPIVPFGHDHQEDCPGVSISLIVHRFRYDSKLITNRECDLGRRSVSLPVVRASSRYPKRPPSQVWL